MKHYKKIFLFILSTVFLAHCASDTSSQLEDAQTLLNKGEYQAALDLSSDVLSSDPTNLEAARVTASAQFGLSGLDTSDLNTALLELSDTTDQHFAHMATAVPSDTDLSYLIAAANTLADCECTLDLDAHFQQGLYQAYASFIAGIVASGYHTGVENFDPSAITDDDITNAQTALIEFDNALITSGVAEDDDMVVEARETYCLASNATGEFNAKVYRAVVCCELLEDDCTAAQVQELTDENGVPILTDCTEVNPANLDLDACKSTDTE